MMRLGAIIIFSILLSLLTTCASSPPAPTPFVADNELQIRSLQRSSPAVEPLTLPEGARQLREGYWLSAMIAPNDAPSLVQMGVRAVLSARAPCAKTLQALERYGIDQFAVPMGASFRHHQVILEVVQSFGPEQILIHCRHGADRTGSIAAFLLVLLHGWTIEDALYSVLYASTSDVNGLAQILASFGIEDHRTADDPSVGFYSVAAAGLVGGLKARNSRYARMVSTTIEAILRVQQEAEDDSATLTSANTAHSGGLVGSR